MTIIRSTPMPTCHAAVPPAGQEHWIESLADGSHVLVRPLRGKDREREQAFIRRLAPESRRCRFLGDMREAPVSLLDTLMEVDGTRSVAFVALAHDGGELREVGIARYCDTGDAARCECAVTVADDWQHRGLAVVLMRRLIEVARSNGYRTMFSVDFAENHAMEELATYLGFTRARDPADATLVVHTLAL